MKKLPNSPTTKNPPETFTGAVGLDHVTDEGYARAAPTTQA